MATPEQMQDTIESLVLANRILSREGVLDAFGHVSVRHPYHNDRYLISLGVSPANVEAGGIIEVTLDGKPLRALSEGEKLYGERVIHGEIYRARSDVHAVCHLHSADVLPFANSGVPIVPVYHVGAVIGDTIPFWDSRDEFGDTNLLVTTREEGASLARALGAHWVVVMRRHGATVAGRSIKEMVFRSVYLQQNARLQLQIQMIGDVSPLTPGEIEKASQLNLSPQPTERAWGYWCARVRDRPME
jgi:ribulose-5-phosphate 4-epimerase/fuculose-1-phosphate aldolase